MTARTVLREVLDTSAYTDQQKLAFINFLYEVLPETFAGTITDAGMLTIGGVAYLAVANTFTERQSIADDTILPFLADTTNAEARLRVSSSAAFNVTNSANFESNLNTSVQLRTASLAKTTFTDTTDATRTSRWVLVLANAGALADVFAVVPNGFGYPVGQGGAVTQLTNKGTAVTLNKPSGAITMNNAVLNAGALQTFILTNSCIEANDTLIVNHKSAGSFGSYSFVAQCAASQATIAVRNVSAGNLSEAIVLQYNLVKGSIT